MAGDADWRGSLTASERYGNIEKIQKALAVSNSTASAFELENAAYEAAPSRHDYDSSCDRLAELGDGHHGPDNVKPLLPQETGLDASNGPRIGAYTHCQYVASGVTAEVYRCQGRALKVIVETRDIEPHNPGREAKILELLKKPCIPLLETFRDQEQRFVLVFPYMPLTLAALLEQGALTEAQVRRLFRDLFNALVDIHAQGIIHRDIKPSALLLESPDGPAYLSDFGTAWHPDLSAVSEPPNVKILDIGTGPYRAPEVLFGNTSYGTTVDMWGAGAMLAECCRRPAAPLFESRSTHEDGNQLGLILSIFKTIGSPTPETWPEATAFKTPPFGMYRTFQGKTWPELLPGVGQHWGKLIAALVRYDSGRVTAQDALQFECFIDQ